jgi:hypothetical protein
LRAAAAAAAAAVKAHRRIFLYMMIGTRGSEKRGKEE